MRPDDGERLGEARGPVWAHFPQTPQAAEYSARRVVAQFMRFPSVLNSDCANAVHPTRYFRCLSATQASDR
eukprot:360516-Pyramimonas_sp.AAC.1